MSRWSSPPTPAASRAWLAAAVFAVVAAAHLRTLPNAFQWDDYTLLLRPELQGWTGGKFLWLWTNTLLGHYVPLTWMSWRLDVLLWGFTPFGFHATNVLLHGANAVLVYFLCLRLSARLRGGGETVPGDLAAAAAAALFFGLHPLRVETVAWATERRGLLSALFCLAAGLRHLEGGRRSPPLLLALAILCKETAMAWPAALWALDVRVLGLCSTREWLRRNAALCAVGAAGALAGAWATRREAIPVSWEEHGPHARLAQLFRGSVFLAGKTLLPLGLSPLYALPLNAGTLSFGRWGPALAGALATLLAFLAGGRKDASRAVLYISAAWLAWAALLAPTAGALQSGPQDTADRYSYLAGVPWALLFGALASRGRGRWALLVLPLLAAVSWRQQSYWKTPETLWRRAAAVDPDSSYAHYNLGVALAEGERWGPALESFQKALVLQPTFERAQYNMAAIHHRLGRRRAAEAAYRRVLWMDPANGMAHNNLGKLLAEAGRKAEAREHLAEARRLLPGSPVVEKNWRELSP